MQAAQLELLQGMSIFGAIREDVLQFLLDRARLVTVPAGQFFFHEGDSAEGMYVLQSGLAAIERDWHGHPVLLRRAGPGDCFGEMALMDLMPRSASVRALQDCVAIEIRLEHLQGLLDRDLEQFALIQMNMGREVSRRLRELADLVFERGTTLPWPEPPEAVRHAAVP